MIDFREVKAGSKWLKRDYVAIMLWFVGRAIQAAAAMDEAVKKEFEELPEGFTFSLGVMPNGPCMIVGKSKRGIVHYMGWDPAGKNITLNMKIKNIEAAILLFTFQESTAVATCRDRLIVDGEVSPRVRRGPHTGCCGSISASEIYRETGSEEVPRRDFSCKSFPSDFALCPHGIWILIRNRREARSAKGYL